MALDDMGVERLFTRAEAQARGLTRYFTGKPCFKGHVTDRSIQGNCLKCKRESERRWHKANPEKTAAQNRRWYRRNTEKAAARACNWRTANPDKAAKAIRRWKNDNHEKHAEQWRLRRARKRGATGSHTAEDIAAIRKAQKDRCAICRKPLRGKWHVDHITPLSKGGTNDRKNIQLACRSCNSTKHAKDPLAFMCERGLLL